MKIDLYEKKFDLDELLYKIKMFEMINNKYPDYIVMNEQTKEVIASQYRYNYIEHGVYFKNNKRHNSEIYGIPVAYNYSLPFGIADIV